MRSAARDPSDHFYGGGVHDGKAVGNDEVPPIAKAL